MASPSSRRRFLAALGGSIGIAGLSGCLSGRLPWASPSVDRTLYVGAYHWGFLLLDDAGDERERVVLDRGSVIRLVAFNVEAEQALETLPTSIRDAIPEHHELEERNEGRIPPPEGGTLHELLEESNERYPDHSVAVVPSGRNHMGGGVGMMMHPLELPHDATGATTATVGATRRGDYTLSCLTYCGYGHPYMDLDGALVVT